MKIVNAARMVDYPEGTIFAEYKGGEYVGDLHIKDSETFGAMTFSLGADGSGLYDYDWNVYEYGPNDEFVILEEHDIQYLMDVLQRSKFLAMRSSIPEISHKKDEFVRCKCGRNLSRHYTLDTHEMAACCDRCGTVITGDKVRHLWHTEFGGLKYARQEERPYNDQFE